MSFFERFFYIVAQEEELPHTDTIPRIEEIYPAREVSNKKNDSWRFDPVRHFTNP